MTLSALPAQPPQPGPIAGRYVRLEKLDVTRHGDDLFETLQGPKADPVLWNYLPYGPFPERADFDRWLQGNTASSDPYFYSVIDQASGQVQGIISLMSQVPAHGRIEIGHVTFSSAMQRSPRSTEAVYLLARESFALGNRRLEWKCNDNNARSKAAALRFGFSFEGVFRQHMLVKGENRDTAWYSIIDSEWPALDAAFQAWLAPENQPAGVQIKKLEQFFKTP